MKDNEIEDLKAEIRATHKEEIDGYEKNGEQIKWFQLDEWRSEFWDAVDIHILQPIRNFKVVVFRRITDSGAVYIALLGALAWESLHFYAPHEEDKPKIQQEYSDTYQWLQQAKENAANIQLIHSFIQIPSQTPHTETPEFPKQITLTYANLSGLSMNVSGHYIK